ncbi:Myo-inositol 2-dehydrogenase [Paenibacillus solanacearum]|uniref:Myo-inositol 2-dehydrogenase n=1 Tax=Paenibacillus solanacearum TaxID=2048548 RepID=A0A916NIG1_9BACL|nr:Gfo/Idh/MocA family oxidoreductase [Paenibacillus solanacearum]CAG7621516.1 Myo-inositol 2-dehydrogenase [Paenibacillus solanacearum]
MKVAIAGCGTMGSIYAERLAEMNDVHLVSMFDRKWETARNVGDRYGATPYDSYDRMLEAEDIDVVCVTMPTFLHKEYVLKAAARKKHIICEKPLALDPADALEMLTVCRAAGSRLFVGHVVRFFPEYQNFRQAVLGGQLGSVGMIRTMRAGHHPGEAKSWYADGSKSGGIFLDLMIHDIDFLRWTLGEIDSVYALRGKTESADYALAVLSFCNGAIANVEAVWGYPGQFTTYVEGIGALGVLTIDNRQQQLIEPKTSILLEGAEKEVVVPHDPGTRDAYYEQLRHFLSCIQSGEESIITAADACKAVEIARATVQSALTGERVILNNC